MINKGCQPTCWAEDSHATIVYLYLSCVRAKNTTQSLLRDTSRCCNEVLLPSKVLWRYGMCCSVVYMSAVYARALPSSNGHKPACIICTVCSCHDKQEVRYRTCFNLRRLHHGCRSCTLAVAQHCPSPIEATCMRTFNFWEIFMRI